MECQPSDSKKVFKVFEASKRKRTRKKREGDDSNSMATDESTGGCQGNGRRLMSSKTSLQDISTGQCIDGDQESNIIKRDSSPSISRSPDDAHRPRSPRRHRRLARDGISLALKAGLVSTPRSISPNVQVGDDLISSVPKDQDSFIYAFLEEAIKRDKKKHRHSRRHGDRRTSHDRDVSVSRERRHHHRRHRDDREREKPTKEETRGLDQAALFETFAKLCAQMNEKTAHYAPINQVPRSQSHKSLQCEVASRRDLLDESQRTVRHSSRDYSRDNFSPSRIRSHEHFHSRNRSQDNIPVPIDSRKDKCVCCDPYEKQPARYSSKVNVETKHYEGERYRSYPPEISPTKSCINGKYRSSVPERRDNREFDDRIHRKYDDRRRPCEQKASRSFDLQRERYIDDRGYRRTARSDGIKDTPYNDRDYTERRYEASKGREKYYDKDIPERNFATLPSKERRSRRNLEKFERASVASRDEDYRDRYSERERDSGLSVADGETSTMSGKSNYLRVVKQEISEQREAMDKMMKLWKELMRCFKGVSQTQNPNKVQESAANVRESAVEQLRLWRECMRRYETVARDVGDTDARLMEEINKQRSEMSEMANMWQECLQRYRDMSNDFNNLKQQLATSESPTRAVAPPLVCAEGEGPSAAPYRLPPTYPPMPPIPPGYVGSPLRSRASAPPAWWWAGEHAPSPRRRSSPESHTSKERRHRHKDRDRDDTRYKEKSKASGARSEHRHRKR
ncbi:zinc finger CCCH domain-containing protein 13-like isoform X2 [Vanessa atalanta]|uniref:zinc finger CCCH domain-containing protein 13-like isoform X2 n=1 Tax=Vanessa atalanta TaxID=42275 RepID=UPI001FCD8DA9|nr:zinc finger CCCH domain-containing protein 13-like isoform X2 [Vanessa atalanta]